MKALEKIFGDPNKKTLKKIQPIVDVINTLEPEFKNLTLDQLKGKTAEFKARLEKGETLDDILPEAFATVREVGTRLLNMRHYDVQLIGGIALHQGRIAEMRTGEGKTLVATLPTYLNSLEGKGVHVVTVNDYLAKRDAVWMAQIYDFLGMSVGIVQSQRETYIYDASFKGGEEGGENDTERDETGSFKVENEFLRPASRQDAYRCDITYGTNNEFGFDYLRDNMVQKREDMVMRPGEEMHYCIIDEIDSILVDEARTPLIISAPAAQATDQYYQFAELVTRLKENDHYNVDEKRRSATLTEEGIAKFEEWLGVDNIYVEGGIKTVHHIEQALKANVLFKKDKDYIVEGGEVVIIDEFTGRKMPGRRYSEGLHQALEAKEKVNIQRESQTLATITYQNLFRMYTKLSGMTGTAETEKEEFYKIYALDVLVIPTNRPDGRTDLFDQIYKTESAKFAAVAKKITECRENGQPILVGTISVEKNEMLSQYLDAQGIKHEALNAKNHEREGEIVAQAGRPGAITLATNMAGRGVDIKLGGVPAAPGDEEKVKAAGGLFVLGTERHDSRRIDNQLRGRSARQGDPGVTQFLVSTDDDLMRIFAGERLKTVMERLKVPDDMPIEQKMINKMLANAQKKVEAHNYDSRKHLLEYDDVLNKQREHIYRRRREVIDLYSQQMAILNGEIVPEKTVEEEVVEITSEEDKPVEYKTLREIVLGMIEDEIEFIVSFHTNTETGGEWNMKEIYETVKTIFPFSNLEREELLNLGNVKSNAETAEFEAREAIVQYLLKKSTTEFETLEKNVSSQAPNPEDAPKMLLEIQKSILLRSIDTLWVEHLVSIDYLRAGIGLRGYAQRDPLVEYRKESFNLFNSLLSDIQKEVVYTIFKINIGIQLAPSIMASDKMTLKGAEKTSVKASGEAVGKEKSADGSKIGRNDRVVITNGSEEKEMKYKKALPLIESGEWKLK